ncbi:MAG TPA: hypothetical protein VN958_17345 [Chitinophagaceae bacterium]|nr:hypothetical protein [Chitinophagaceae bacterium]
MKWVITILFLITTVTLQAQGIFKTVSAKVLLPGLYDSSSVGAESHGMYIIINYDRARIDMKMNLRSIVTTNDTLNIQIQNSPEQEFHFTGKMKLDYVRTKTHPTQKFPVDGMLTVNGISHPLSFNAILYHIANSGDAAKSIAFTTDEVLRIIQ